jgi:ADP-ribosyl-[dinitrogen reductase] hydrolase
MPNTTDQFAACLLGGAVGDALGAPVEFMDLEDIRQRYGLNGITDFDIAYGKVGAITDDTQMTLFTAEGLICAAELAGNGEQIHIPTVVNRAYLRWLRTQDESWPGEHGIETGEGSLLKLKGMWSRRAPGNSCLSALHADGMGTSDNPINNSKGCGGVMRIAPVGLIAADPFRMGCDLAALTHGHPSGYIAAGFFAQVVRGLVNDLRLDTAIDAAMEEARQWPGCDETVEAVTKALELADSADAIPETVEQLGGGWIAEEALAISLFCALKTEDFDHGVRLAVNHTGDSDSTGAMTGNLLGIIHGLDAVPDRWLEKLELRGEIRWVAEELYRVGTHA